MKQFIAFFLITFALTFFLLLLQYVPPIDILSPLSSKYWQVQSIDTMKYSRDGARKALDDPSFDLVIEKQMQDIADTGATHVAINTPYDKEFLPVMKRWVVSARKHNLKVWFRGNWSGWEGWFDYPRINRTTHIRETEKFILENEDLFENGDIFTACPECENGDVILTNDQDEQQVKNYRAFLIQEYQTTTNAFQVINKEVISNYNSMNGHIARIVMDRATTEAMGGVVTIDHYVATPEKLEQDIAQLAEASGGKIVLGEFGAPLPNIHGSMTEAQQQKWINDALKRVAVMPEVIAINYWVNVGGSTALWKDDGTPKPVVSVIKKYYKL